LIKLNFQKELLAWYQIHKRTLPWRSTTDAYVIWLSEIILQQTRVVQGLPYFEKFIAHFPTVTDLANAEEQEVLALWQGLGYYSRARNLHATAKIVVQDYDSVFPTTYRELIKLKGVGDYTASAIASFSSNEAVAVLDGNVFRVFARLLGVDTPINTSEGMKLFKQITDEYLYLDDPSTYNQAIMEFGAIACMPKKPNCFFCPFAGNCVAYNTGKVGELPVKLKKNKIKKRYFHFVIDKNKEGILLEKRVHKDIWQHLYQFPLVETNSNQLIVDLPSSEFADLKLISQNKKTHKLSHQHIYASFYEGNLITDNSSKYIRVSSDQLKDYPLPVLLTNFLEETIVIL